MDELKPKLILTKPTKSGGSRFKFFLTLLITFALGVLIGTKLENRNTQVIEKKDADASISEMLVQHGEKKPLPKNQLSVTPVATEPVKNSEESKQEELKPWVSKPLSESEVYKADKYTIQVAAFDEMEKAQKIANELKVKGYNAYIVSTYNSRGEAWDLIKVGKFKTKEEAQDFASLFQEKENMEAIVEELNVQ
jgi:cell division septation protein DedD